MNGVADTGICSAAEVLHLADQFREMMLATHSEPGMALSGIYDKIRRNDPSRRVAGHPLAIEILHSPCHDPDGKAEVRLPVEDSTP